MSTSDISSTLGSRFWVTSDNAGLAKVVSAASKAGCDDRGKILGGFSFSSVPSSDTTRLSLAHSGCADRLTAVFERAKSFASRFAEAAHPYNEALARKVGLYGNLPDIVTRLSLKEQAAADADFAPDSDVYSTRIADAVRVMHALLATNEFKAINDVKDLSEDQVDAITARLANAAVGVLKLMREDKVTIDSIFELSENNVYDLTHAADLYTVTAKTCEKAHDLIRSIRPFMSLPMLFKDDATKKECIDLISRIYDFRSRIASSLSVPTKPDPPTAANLEKAVRTMRETMRAFRYDVDVARGTTGDNAMTRFRRWMDDLGSSGKGRLAKADLDGEAKLIGELNKLLKENGLPDELAFQPLRDSQELQRATDLTHTANNQIRYYFSGHARKQDLFAAKAHKILDDMSVGDTRTVRLAVTASLAAELGIGDAALKASYTHDITIAKTLDGFAIIKFDGASLTGEAGVGDSLTGKKDKGAIDTTLSVSAKVEAGIGKKRAVTYRSANDLIVALKGKGDVLDVSHHSVHAVLGKIWMGVRTIGSFFVNAASKLGFREHHTRIDFVNYQSKLVSNGVLDATDTVLARTSRAVMSQESHSWVRSIEGKLSANLSIGTLKDDVEEDAEGIDDENMSKLFEAEAAVNGRVSKEFAVKTTHFRPLTESMAGRSLEWLIKETGPSLTPHSLDDVAIHMRSLETKMRRNELYFASLPRTANGRPSEEALRRFAENWKRFAATAELLKRAGEIFLKNATAVELCAAAGFASSIEKNVDSLNDIRARLKGQIESISSYLTERLNHPAVTLTDDEFRTHFLEETFSETVGSTTVSLGGSVSLTGLEGPLTEDISLPGDPLPANIDLNARRNALMDTLTPLDQQFSFAITQTEPSKTDDVRPWKNGIETDITVSFAVNMSTRALATRIVDQLLKAKGPFREDRPDLRNDLIEDLEFNLKWARADQINARANKALTNKLEDKFGKDVVGLDTESECDNRVSMTFHYEGTRLTRLFESETLTSTGKLGASVKLGAVSLGLSVSSTAQEESVTRSIYTPTSIDSILKVAEAFNQKDNGLSDFEAFTIHSAKGLFRALRAAQNYLEIDAPLDLSDPHAERDRDETVQRLKTTFGLLTLIARNKNLTDRAEQLHSEFGKAMDEIERMDFSDPDVALLNTEVDEDDTSTDAEALRKKIADEKNRIAEAAAPAARFLSLFAKVFTLAREAGLSAKDFNTAARGDY